MMVAPGYILSRSKAKTYMYIKTDEFFQEGPANDQNQGPHQDRYASIFYCHFFQYKIVPFFLLDCVDDYYQSTTGLMNYYLLETNREQRF